MIASESNPGERLDTALIKQYTSRESIMTRRLHSNVIEDVQKRGKLWFVTNHFPSFPQDDEMLNRLVPIEFNKVVPRAKQDCRLLDKLTDNDNAPGVLAWCIEGAIKWNGDHQWNTDHLEGPRRDPLGMTRDTGKLVKELKSKLNPLRKWLDEKTIVDLGNEEICLQSSVAHNDYVKFCTSQGLVPVSKSKFKNNLVSEGICYKKRSTSRYYIGITLNSQL